MSKNILFRKHHSLSSRVFRIMLTGSIALGFVGLVVGLGLYTYAIIRHYIVESSNLTRSAVAVLDKVADVELLADDVMEIYSAQTKEELEQRGKKEYDERFAGIIKKGNYDLILRVLTDFSNSSDIDAIYLAMYDEKTGNLVFFAVPEYETGALLPGNWEKVPRKELERFLNRDGSDLVYHIGKTEAGDIICTSGTPIYGKNGDIKAFVLCDVSMANIRHSLRFFLGPYFVATFIMTMVFSILVLLHFKKTVVTPINDIADAAKKYARDKKEGNEKTDHFSSLSINTNDEIENLSIAMKDMEKDLVDYEKSLTNITAEKERIRMELSLATRIQLNMLPNVYPAFPDRSEFDIYAFMHPAREVGGDFYDYFLIDEDHLCLFIADVSGKGIPAALFMMASMIIIANNAMLGKNPGEILKNTNDAICSNNKNEMFVTVWLGILEISSGVMKMANAGHEYPALSDKNGHFEFYKTKHGVVIGGLEGSTYTEDVINMKPGEKLFLYTDGAPEATNSENEMYGMKRLLNALNKTSNSSTRNTVEVVKNDINNFVNDAEQFDDLTLMCFEYRKK
ncbi:MAG: PP2C family protein-serine/threonine phosphatase [Lachnospiraceae bacterium]|nr:PP2C family protein-serine/threonine phosphatase [Lachnospiraceae bacterium]